jgi:cyclopropane fatty-acyl-phospholipid synthase-like methyltransferase
MIDQADQANSAVWRKLYAQGKNDLRYPNEFLVRLGARLLNKSHDRRILDFGFGTGANLVHLATQGFETHGVEISEHAVARTKERLQAAGLSGDVRLIEAGQRLPYDDFFFDVVYAWQVLYYHSREGWKATVAELERVTRKGGLVMIATAAPGDISQVEAEPLGNDMYRSRVSGQEGCVLTIPDREALTTLFPGRQLEVGEFGFQFEGNTSRHWVIVYRMAGS